MAPGKIVIKNYLRRLDNHTGCWENEAMTTTKYACDIIAPTKILDRDTGETVVIDTIEVIPNTDMLIFFGYFEEDGSPWERQLDWDSKVRVAEDA